MSVSSSAGGGAYRGRLAPSPTGLLHLGHARTFWIAAERARAARGALVLRNEDLDPQRSKQAYVAAMLDDLRWLGLRWQEGPDRGGPCAPYNQSERRPLYLAAWRRLVEAGWLYPCSCTRRELRERAGAAPHAYFTGLPEESSSHRKTVLDEPDEDESMYPGTCRPDAEVPGGVPSNPDGINWRFRVPDGERVRFTDGGFGSCSYTAGTDFGDFLVWRREGVAAYQLAVVVDDAAMGITEVVRGADLLRSTVRQLLLYRALDLVAPAWFHCPLVVDAEGRRLAKRTDARSIRALREAGRTPAEVLAMAGVATLG